MTKPQTLITEFLRVTEGASSQEQIIEMESSLERLRAEMRSVEAIVETVGSSNRRYTFKNAISVVNLGLRLDDVDRMGLEFERAPLGDVDLAAVRERLRINGATEREIGVLVDKQIRCELNAMTSDQFIAFVEEKLDEAGVATISRNTQIHRGTTPSRQ